jgi:predicted dehydrogenase
MYTIVGSGFGLYGYLPALVEGLGAAVVLPRAYEAKVRARPELAGTLRGIHWADDADAALRQASVVVIATRPRRQVDVAAQCAALPAIERLVLEKPLAPSPEQAKAMLALLDRAGKRYRVGYTLLHAGWCACLDWPRAAAQGDEVRIEWTFMAHHFAQGVSTWKRIHAEGGGVLRFFGVHLLALLVRHGYERVRESTLEGEVPGEPERWSALFSAAGLPDCRVLVDSRSATTRFTIAHHAGASRDMLVDLRDPFAGEPAAGDADRRVGVLARLLATFAENDRGHNDFYARVNALWLKVEHP